MFSASPNPEDFNLPLHYTFAETSWGQFLFYKIYNEKLNYGDAKARCESDDAFLAIPRSETENDFFAGSTEWNDEWGFWIGINDIEQEGNFVAVDGREIPWTPMNWGTDGGEPNGGANENAVEIRPHRGNDWNDNDESLSKNFVCSLNIEGNIKDNISILFFAIKIHVQLK